uniref:Sodium/hydrogen exchanger n=1 Tax=Trepomonas sp. PC1 TaxID=1076344 RepID=A0A146K793_9EUKA|eukprot:JAP92712.1 Sodium/hydrogen exchanger [Trepomonas sp. PC1]
MLITLIRIIYEKTKMKAIIPESCLLIVVGMLTGLVVVLVSGAEESKFQDLLTFPPDLFLQVFVPIIIFDATYFLNKHAFFHNFLEIVTFAVIGTLLSTVIIGLLMIATSSLTIAKLDVGESLTYAALVSAVDPVAVISIMESVHINENIFNLVFGESTLNDGVAIVLFNLFKQIGSLKDNSIGEIVGLAVAKFVVSISGAIILASAITFLFCFISKITIKIPNTEPLLFFICALCCYTLADMCLFSGVIAIMTCALISVRYLDYNMQQSSLQTFQNLIHMLAQTFESMLFFDMGCQFAFTISQETEIDYGLALMNIAFTLIARTVATVVQTFFLNFRRKKLGEQLTYKDQIILIMSGLRGGIAFALVRSWDIIEAKSKQVVFTTAIIILFTIIVYGLLMKPMIKKLKVKLELVAHTGFDYASVTLVKPVKNVHQFALALLGKDNKFDRWTQKVDLLIQSIVLKRMIPMDRELIDNVEQIKMIQINKIKAEQEAKQKQIDIADAELRRSFRMSMSIRRQSLKRELKMTRAETLMMSQKADLLKEFQ